ncbi:tetraspanin-15-like [Callorhinchus milii]|uniref:tetraspanin-15-like n=1 Tax=Callorhinchus milii TaxID=7868 RepID=UPI001C3FEC1D|nr:tetraspanin-15-like [Callorhinchus milii]
MGSAANLQYYILKLTLVVSATLFWLVGLAIVCVGTYAEVERQRNKTLGGLFVAPAVVLLLLGSLIFSVAFVGMVGALRDNKRLLRVFQWILFTVLCLQLTFIVVFVLCRNKVLGIFKANVQEGIRHYYDDLDFKNILDKIQVKFACCGGDEYMDWEANQYHACQAPGPSACGVPYTCCVREQEGDVINTQCGYQALRLERVETDGYIYARGCVDAISLWFEDNLSVMVGILVAMLLPQLVGSVLTWSYLKTLPGSGDLVDGFRALRAFEDVDVSGAGWCLCLPREGGYQPLDIGAKDYLSGEEW